MVTTMENFWLTQGLRQRLRKVCLIRRLLFLFLGSDNDYWTTPSAKMPFVVGCKVVNRKKNSINRVPGYVDCSGGSGMYPKLDFLVLKVCHGEMGL